MVCLYVEPDTLSLLGEMDDITDGSLPGAVFLPDGVEWIRPPMGTMYKGQSDTSLSKGDTEGQFVARHERLSPPIPIL